MLYNVTKKGKIAPYHGIQAQLLDEYIHLVVPILPYFPQQRKNNLQHKIRKLCDLTQNWFLIIKTTDKNH